MTTAWGERTTPIGGNAPSTSSIRRDGSDAATGAGAGREPITLLSMSDRDRWPELTIDRCVAAPRVGPIGIDATERFTLGVMLSGGCGVESSSAREPVVAHYAPGSLGMTAPDGADTLRWTSSSDSPIRLLNVSISPDAAARALADIGFPGVLPRLDRLHFQSPAVVAAVRGISQAVDAGAPAAGVHSLIAPLMASLVQASAPLPRERTLARGGLGLQVLLDVVQHIERNLHSTVRLQDLADLAFVSPFHFTRRFRDAFGVTPLHFVQQRRLDRAARLFAVTDLPVGQVMASTGWTSRSHFSTAFRRRHGTSPMSFRAQQTGRPAGA